ncbi:hypothetical protein ACFW35_04915 [Fictibacillus sp. NPDC058756]|uniref:hypothetical protein n=1 Tax=Fictibacillus sp. NPDC058756 TaxID=3346625 RepID=UPI0036BAFFF2
MIKINFQKYILLGLVLVAFVVIVDFYNDEKSASKQNEIKIDSWDVSSILKREITATDTGIKDDFVFHLGNNGKLGFQSENGIMVAEKPQRYLWFFWIDQKIFEKPLEIIGIHKKTGDEFTVFNDSEGRYLSGKGLEYAIPTLITLPEKGIWRLEVYFGKDLLGSVVVKVN